MWHATFLAALFIDWSNLLVKDYRHEQGVQSEAITKLI